MFQLAEIEQVDGSYRKCKTGLVAKKSRFYQNDGRKKIDFHEKFCDTQMRASKFASKFNAELVNAFRGRDLSFKDYPRVEFLECFVYVVYDGEIDRELLCEKMLDNKRFFKWNGNDGYVSRKVGVLGDMMESIAEEEEEHDGTNDVLQAFSHFTYRESKRKIQLMYNISPLAFILNPRIKRHKRILSPHIQIPIH